MSSSSMDASAIFGDPDVVSLFSGMLSDRRIRLAVVRGPEKAGGSLSSSTIAFVIVSNLKVGEKISVCFQTVERSRLLEIFLVFVYLDGGRRF